MNLFKSGPRNLREKFNRQDEQVKSVLNYNLRGSEFINVQHVGGRAQTISLNLLALLRRLGKRGGGGSGIRTAYIKTQPSSGQTATCYLDSYSPPGAEITVDFSRVIYDNSGNGGTFDQVTRPLLVAGTSVEVRKDGATWRSITPIFRAKPCNT